MKTFLIYHLPLLLYAAVVLAVSSIPNLKTPQVRFLAADKLAHFLEYSLFAFLAYRSMTRISPNVGERLPLLLSLLLLAAFAILDEYLQSFIPGRSPELWDYATDLAGGSLILAVLWYRQRRKRQS